MVFFVPVSIVAQTGGASATLTATVSETVALSVSPNSIQSNVETDVMSSGRTVRITLSGAGTESPVIRVPLIVRSNSSFKISAAVESKTAELTQFSVVDVRATGALVSPAAISNLEVAPQFDLSRPFLVLSGPRVSLGGTLDSPNNAVQITVLIQVKPLSTEGWLAHLTLSALGPLIP